MAFAARAAVLATVALTAACGGAAPTSTPSAAPTPAERAASSVATAGNLISARGGATLTLLPSGKVLAAGGWASAGLKTCELFDPQTGRWTSAASMATERSGHTATLLPNGTVLVAGGMTGAYADSAVASAELYDPATDRWSATGSLRLARTGFTATLLADGRVLAVGGSLADYTMTAKAELYDPATGSWAYTTDAGAARGGHAATRLRDGRVLVTGGAVSTAAGEIYDPAGATWTTTTDPGTARFSHGAILLQDGRVLVVGGSVPFSAQLYDPEIDQWSATAAAPLDRGDGTAAALLPSGKVLVTGGSTAGAQLTSTLYDPVADGWSDGPPLASVRAGHRAVMLHSGKLLLGPAGGGDRTSEVVEARTGTWTLGSPNPAPRFNLRGSLLHDGRAIFAAGHDGGSMSLAAELYAPATGAWTAANLARTRDWAALTLLPSGKVLVTGGEGGSGPVAEAELFDPANDGWSLVAGPITPRSGHCAVLLHDGRVLVAGGSTALDPALASAELYDPATGSWTVTGSMAKARMQFTATVLRSGAVLVTGGMDAAGVVDSAELFDPATGSWSNAARPVKPRARAAAALLPSGAVLLTGGYATADGGPTADVELYDPDGNGWRSLPAMAIRREMHGATVLATGEVMAVGGSGGTSEVFDPATERWQGAGPTSSAMAHAALLLPSGELVVAGGHDGTSPTGATWRFDLDAEAPVARRPAVSPPGASAERGRGFTLAGSRFRMGSEAAPGALPNTSAVGPPMVQLRGYSGRLDWLPVTSETDTAVTFTVPSDLPTGRYLVAVVAGGVASPAVPLTVVQPAPPTEPPPPADEPADSPLAFSCGNGAGGPALASVALIALALGRRRGRSLLAALLVLLPLAATAAPPPAKGAKGGKGRIAVMPLKAGTGVDPQLVEMVTDAFVAELYRRGVATITMSDVEAALGFERQKQLLGCQDDRSCLAEIAGALGTDRIVSGSVSRVEAVTAVRLQLFDSRGAVVEKRFYETHSGATAAQLLEAARRAGGVLFPDGSGAAVAAGSPAPPVAAPGEPQPRVAPLPAEPTPAASEPAVDPAPVAPRRFSLGTGALYDPVDPGGFATVLAEWRHASGFRVGAGPVVTGAATFGLAARAAWTPLPARRLRPFAAIHALAVLDGGPLFWGGVGLGAEWAFDAHLSVGVDLPVLRILTGPASYKNWYLLPGLSVAWTP